MTNVILPALEEAEDEDVDAHAAREESAGVGRCLEEEHNKVGLSSLLAS